MMFQLVSVLIDNLLSFCNQYGLTEVWHTLSLLSMLASMLSFACIFFAVKLYYKITRHQMLLFVNFILW